MSTTALAEIDSKVVARTAPRVTEAEAEAAANNCGFDLQLLTNITNKAQVGVYLEKQVHGNIIASAFVDKESLETVQGLMKDIVTDSDQAPENRIAAANTFAKIIGMKNEVSTIQLKAVEIGGHTRPKDTLQSVGPPIDI